MIAINRYRLVEPSMRRVVFEQVRQVVSRDDIVDRDELDTTCLETRPLEQTTDPLEPFDSHLDRNRSLRRPTGAQ